MGEPIATVGDLAGICGHDGTNWEKILIDASKRLVVAVASAIASDVQLHGYYDGAWQKAPIPWGFSDVCSDGNIHTKSGAGNYDLDVGPVPEGEVWVISHTVAVNYNTDPSAVTLKTVDDATARTIHREAFPGAGTTVEAPNPVYLREGMYMRATFNGCSDADILQAWISGYKMDLDL